MVQSEGQSIGKEVSQFDVICRSIWGYLLETSVFYFEF